MSFEIVNKLKNCDEETRNNVIRLIIKDVSYRSRDMKASDFVQWVHEFIAIITNQLITSILVNDKLSVLMTLDALIDELDDATIPPTVAKTLLTCLQDKDDAVLDVAYTTLGKLYRIRFNLMTELLNSELRVALEVLDKSSSSMNSNSKFNQSESRKLAAVLVLALIAEKAPSNFYSNVDYFIKNIWTALHDTNKESK